MSLTRTRANLLEYAYQNILGGSIDDVSRSRAERGLERALELISLTRRFSFLQDTYDIITTPDVVFTNSLSINVGAAAVSDSASSIPDTVGSFFEFNGERHWYEMTARASAAAATIRQNYTNESATNLSGVSGKMLTPLYDLPANFVKERALFDTSTGDDIEYVPYDEYWWSKMERIGQGEPEWYTIMASRNDPNQWQIGLMPAPDVTKRYQLVYFRKPGWFTTATPATSTWANQAPTGTSGDTYYVDWPDQLSHILEAAVLASVAKEIKPSAANSYRQIFDMEVNKAANFDNKTSKPMYLSRGGGRGRRGTRVDF